VMPVPRTIQTWADTGGIPFVQQNWMLGAMAGQALRCQPFLPNVDVRSRRG
jgi:hypothetical protein